LLNLVDRIQLPRSLFQEAGFDAHLVKPVDLHTFSNLLLQLDNGE
jgi:hypothetical protein